MKMALLSVCALVLSAGAAAAHHSYGMFDRTKEQPLTGVVTTFEWTNPHAWLYVSVDKAGKAETWGLEMGSPGTLSRTGWKRTTLKAGDKVEVVIHPLRDGSTGGSLIGLTTADGRRFGSLEYRGQKAAAN